MLKHNPNIRKHFFTVRMTEHQHKFPRAVLKFLPLEIFNTKKGYRFKTPIVTVEAFLSKPDLAVNQ